MIKNIGRNIQKKFFSELFANLIIVRTYFIIPDELFMNKFKKRFYYFESK
jgi:hypothetical protein